MKDNRDGDVRLLCWCVLINSNVYVCTGLCVPVCVHLVRANIACGESYLILSRGNTDSPPCLFSPLALWTQAAAGDADWLGTACPERRSEGRRNSLVSWQLDATNQKFGVANGATGEVGQPVAAYWRRRAATQRTELTLSLKEKSWWYSLILLLSFLWKEQTNTTQNNPNGYKYLCCS